MATSSQTSSNSEVTRSVYHTHGVAVHKYTPATPIHTAPVVMIHGGDHAAWCWEKWATSFCQAGYEVHAFDWYNHGESEALPEKTFIARSILDVAKQELTYVIEDLQQEPILISHSMGGLVAASYAAEAPVERLVLVAPVMPAVVKPQPIPLPVDPALAFQVMPYPQAKQLFFTTMDDSEARKYYALLEPESAAAVTEATTWSAEVDVAAIKAPSMIVSAEQDQLIPLDALKRYAELLGATHHHVSNCGHCDLLLKEPVCLETAQAVQAWLQS